MMEKQIISYNKYIIGIIDDEKIYQDKIYELLKLYFPCANIDIFSSYQEMEAQDNYYSFLILDIKLNKENGIDLSRNVKRYTQYVIYYSAIAKAVRFAFSITTIGFILKTDTDAQVYKLMYELNERYFSKVITVLDDAGKTCIDVMRVCYMIRENRKVALYTIDGERKVLSHVTLKQVVNTSNDSFIQIHISIFVNIHHVIDIHKNVIYMDNGKSFIIARSRFEDVKKAFFRGVI